ncbi:MAG: AAA family ATPase [Sphaerochaeta sp.]
MATAEQIKALVRFHSSEQPEQFFTVALQIAAHEAPKGHIGLAHDIQDIIDKAREQQNKKVLPFSTDLEHLIITTEPTQRLPVLVQSEGMKERIQRILREYRQKDKLEKYGLSHRRKILLVGPPGTGKTLTASILASELNLPLYIILLDKLVTKYMGETSAKLRLIFDTIPQRRGVYFFDEFDAIGGERSLDNDVGEMRRVLNSFLQLIERDDSQSLIVAATNNPKILDQALFRRFDDILAYQLPDDAQVLRLLHNRLASFSPKAPSLQRILPLAHSLSHAEITQACDDAIKEAILNDQTSVTIDQLERMLSERRAVYNR